MTEPESADIDRLRSMVNGYQVSQAISAAVTLGVPDLLAGGPRRLQDLAVETQAHAPSLYRLLRALCSLGVLATAGPGDDPSFDLTPLGELLRSDTTGSLAAWAAFVGRPAHWDAWGHLVGSVRTGRDAFSERFGEGVWAWRERHPDESQIFDRAMSAVAAIVARGLVDGYDFAPFAVVADLGGGDGTLLAAVLARHRGVQGVLFDLPHVVVGARDRLAEAGVLDRCRLLGGSLFDGVPSGCDAYVLKSVLHDWDDASSVRILDQVRHAAGPAATLLVVERVVTEPDPTPTATMSDLNMMVSTGGAERTMNGWRALLAGGGFELTRTVDIGLGWSVVEARPAAA